jgi:hypothetical protein
MNPITQISPISDSEAAALVSGDTLAGLAGQITSTPAPGRAWTAARRPAARRPAARRPAARRLLIGIPAAAALAVAGLVATSVGSPGQKLGPVTVGPPKAEAAALSFTRHGGYLDVIVRNPLADAKKYRQEFARYGLNISLTLVPASPSLVGTLVFASAPTSGPQLIPITAIGRCFTGGGGNVCPVGVRVPLDFRGQADLTFGRAARPGELYETTAAANAPGEALHGLSYVGKTVAQVLPLLAARHVTAAHYLLSEHCENVGSYSAPASWYVTDADPWAPGEVQLWVSKTRLPGGRLGCTRAPSPAPLPPVGPGAP